MCPRGGMSPTPMLSVPHGCRLSPLLELELLAHLLLLGCQWPVLRRRLAHLADERQHLGAITADEFHNVVRAQPPFAVAQLLGSQHDEKFVVVQIAADAR